MELSYVSTQSKKDPFQNYTCKMASQESKSQ